MVGRRRRLDGWLATAAACAMAENTSGTANRETLNGRISNYTEQGEEESGRSRTPY